MQDKVVGFIGCHWRNYCARDPLPQGCVHFLLSQVPTYLFFLLYCYNYTLIRLEHGFVGGSWPDHCLFCLLLLLPGLSPSNFGPSFSIALQGCIKNVYILSIFPSITFSSHKRLSISYSLENIFHITVSKDQYPQPLARHGTNRNNRSAYMPSMFICTCVRKL